MGGREAYARVGVISARVKAAIVIVVVASAATAAAAAVVLNK